MWKKTHTFTARGEDGREVTLYEYTEVVPAPTMGDPDATLDGMPSYKTEDGESVNSNGNGIYEIVNSGEKLTSDYSGAP